MKKVKQHKRALILTVGGSIEPLISSIEINKPDYILFIASDDGKEETSSYYCIDQDYTIKKQGKIIKKTKKNSIIDRSSYQGEYDIIKTKNFDNLFELLKELKEEYLRRQEKLKSYVVKADYTGGTKSMSAALSLLAFMYSGKIELNLMQGQRKDKQKIEEGEQALSLLDFQEEFILSNIDLSHYDYTLYANKVKEFISLRKRQEVLLNDIEEKLDELKKKKKTCENL